MNCLDKKFFSQQSNKKYFIEYSLSNWWSTVW